MRLLLRSDEPLRVYFCVDGEPELLCGLGQGEMDVSVEGPGTIRFTTDGYLWAFDPARFQIREAQSTEIFTSLERPAVLSPEMLAISRMMRQNEIAREQDRQTMGALRNELREARDTPRSQQPDARTDDQRDVDENPAAPKKKVRKKPGTSAPAAKGRAEPDDVPFPHPDETSDEPDDT